MGATKTAAARQVDPAPRPWALAKVDLAKNGLMPSSDITYQRLVRQTGSASTAVSCPVEGSRVTAEGIQPRLNCPACTQTKGALPRSVHP